jgi:phytoene dehydrogenase-like protein
MRRHQMMNPTETLPTTALPRHYGGINYPLGGVGLIGEEMAAGIEERGGRVIYKANVKEIIVEEEAASPSTSGRSGSGGGSSGERRQRATGVRLADGRVYKGKVVISNATRWVVGRKGVCLVRPASAHCCLCAAAVCLATNTSPFKTTGGTRLRG